MPVQTTGPSEGREITMVLTKGEAPMEAWVTWYDVAGKAIACGQFRQVVQQSAAAWFAQLMDAPPPQLHLF